KAPRRARTQGAASNPRAARVVVTAVEQDERARAELVQPADTCHLAREAELRGAVRHADAAVGARYREAAVHGDAAARVLQRLDIVAGGREHQVGCGAARGADAARHAAVRQTIDAQNGVADGSDAGIGVVATAY